MNQEESSAANQSRWEGAFDNAAYAAARDILKADRERVEGELRAETKRRARAIGIVAAIWAIGAVVLGIIDTNYLLIAEIALIVIVIWAVYYIIPPLMGRSGANDAFDQYAAQLDKLEAQGIAMPQPSDMPDLVAAIDLVSPPESSEAEPASD